MTDVRIFLAGLAAWAGVALSIAATRIDSYDRARLVVSVALVCAGLSVVLLIFYRGVVRTVSVMVMCACIAASAAALHTRAWSEPPVVAALSAPHVDVLASVVGEPERMPLSPFDEGARWRVMLRVHEVRTTDSHISTNVPVTLVMTAEQFHDLVPSTVVAVSGRMKATPGDLRSLGYLTASERPRVIESPNVVNVLAQRIRAALQQSLQQLPVNGGSLVAGLAVGDESAVPETLREDMRDSGLAHLTAVSGGNVAIVIGAAILTAMTLGFGLLGRAVTALAMLAFYVVVVSPEPSVVRAAVMGAIVVIGLLLGGRRAGPAVLGTAVLIIAIIAPYLAMTWGFALSVSAASGIIIIAPRMSSWAINRWNIPHSPQRFSRARITRVLIVAVSVTVSASVMTAPVLLAMGASVGLVSIPANLLAMPVVPLVTILGLLATVIGVLLPPLGTAIAAVAFVPAAWIAWIAEHAVYWPLPRIDSLTGLLAVSLFVVGIAWALRRFRDRRVRVGLLITASVVLLLWWWSPVRGWPPDDWFLVMCDVGQGDALLMRSTTHVVMVDVGGDDGRADACLDEFGISHLDALVITHFHADHAGGVASTLHGRTVDAVYATPVMDPPEQFARFNDRMVAAGVPWFTVTAGAQMKIPGIPMWVIWPRYFIRESPANNGSVVVWTKVAHTTVLLTGDIEPEAQRAFVQDLGLIDVVKVPHHGSRFQLPELAELTQPDIALISVGADNEYGHPAPETLAQWQAAGAQVLRTDLLGTVALSRSAAGAPLTVTTRGMLTPP